MLPDRRRRRRAGQRGEGEFELTVVSLPRARWRRRRLQECSIHTMVSKVSSLPVRQRRRSDAFFCSGERKDSIAALSPAVAARPIERSAQPTFDRQITGWAMVTTSRLSSGGNFMGTVNIRPLSKAPHMERQATVQQTQVNLGQPVRMADLRHKVVTNRSTRTAAEVTVWTAWKGVSAGHHTAWHDSSRPPTC